MNRNKSAVSKAFKEEVTPINIEMEYPGYEGDEKYILLTDTPEVILKAAYPEEMKRYSPYVVCPSEMKNIMRSYEANEKKHEWRANREAKIFAQEVEAGKNYKEISELGFVEKVEADEKEEAWSQRRHTAVRMSLEALTDEQKRRLELHVHQEMDFNMIADHDGVSKEAARKSVRRAEEIFRREFAKNMKLIRKSFS